MRTKKAQLAIALNLWGIVAIMVFLIILLLLLGLTGITIQLVGGFAIVAGILILFRNPAAWIAAIILFIVGLFLLLNPGGLLTFINPQDVASYDPVDQELWLDVNGKIYPNVIGTSANDPTVAQLYEDFGHGEAFPFDASIDDCQKLQGDPIGGSANYQGRCRITDATLNICTVNFAQSSYSISGILQGWSMHVTGFDPTPQNVRVNYEAIRPGGPGTNNFVANVDAQVRLECDFTDAGSGSGDSGSDTGDDTGDDQTPPEPDDRNFLQKAWASIWAWIKGIFR